MNNPSRQLLQIGLRGACSGLLLLGSLSCTKPGPVGEEPSQSDSCSLFPGPAQEGGTVVIALLDDVDPAHAPVPQNGSERLLFQHLYETLLRIDCSGMVVPGLAQSWQSQADGREWHFTLRDGARFWDGSPLKAEDVVASWQDAASARSQRAELPWEGGRSATALDDRRIQVSLTEARSHVPREFADPILSVSRERDFSGWPVGSGPHRPSGPETERSFRGTQRMITAYPVTPRSWTVLRFRLAHGVDPRRLLEERVDLLITDRIPMEEASGWPDFTTRLLPWQTTYAVTSPSQVVFDALTASFPANQRDGLARDVLRTAARGAEPPSWWSETDPCGLAFAPLPPRTPVPQVVYEENDLHARALAERVVALSADSLRVVPLPRQSFASALQGGSDMVYVLALPSSAASPCTEAQALLQRAPWLLRRGRIWTGEEWTWSPANPRSAGIRDLSLETRILPLVETRPILMVRQGLVGIGMGADGSLRLDRIGWSPTGDSP